jgi:acetate kinase
LHKQSQFAKEEKMRILALNSGSSSIKYSLFEASQDFQLLAKGLAERIGLTGSAIRHDGQRIEIALPDHRTAMHALHENFHLDGKIGAVGHRIVHGGERLQRPTLINQEVIQQIREAARFAPLHCQPNLIGMEVARELLPDVPHVAIFDTAAHESMEAKAYLYGIPIEYYEKYKIRKYGFHGINHQYVAIEAARLLDKPLEKLKMVTCHLGNGCSISAFKNGRSCDNSMGLTPLEGVVMGSRCGDLDPSVVLYLIEVLGLQTAQITDLLNRQSGLLGLCGKSDMRDILNLAKGGDKGAQTALDVFVYRVQKYIGAFIAALNGVDLIVFTGGIGENSAVIRALVLDHFCYVGAVVDPEKNQKNEPLFSSEKSEIYLLTIPANEERVIAQQTYKLSV